MTLKLGTQAFDTLRTEDLVGRKVRVEKLMKEANVQALLFDANANPIQQWALGSSGFTLYAPGHKPKQINGSEFILEGSAVPVVHWAPHPDTVELVYGLAVDDIYAWVGKNGRLGVFYADAMCAPLADFLAKHLPDVELVDVAEAFNLEKAEKTDFEVDVLRLAARRHDTLFRALPAVMNPAVVERDLVQQIRHLAAANCESDCGSFFGTMVDLYSGKEGQWAEDEPLLYPGRALADGDLVQVKLQASIANGYYGVLGRCFSMGEPAEESKAACKVSAEAAEAAAKLLTPGSTIAKAAEAAKALIAQNGYHTPEMCNIYTIGGVYADVPMLDGEGQDAPLKENMVLAVGFPVAKGEGSFPIACWDAWVVKTGGAVCLSGVEKEIQVV